MSSSLDDLLSAASSFSIVSVPRSVGAGVGFASAIVPGGSPSSMEGVMVGELSSPPEGTGGAKRCYPVVLVNGSDRSLCFGSVAGTGSACFCLRKACKIKTHAENKISGINGKDTVYFIARVPGAPVFSEPNVKEAHVPKETRVEWTDKAWTLPQWVRAFRAVTIADAAGASNDDIKAETRQLLVDAERFKTPSKKRKAGGAAAGSEKDEVGDKLMTMEIVAHERSLPEEEGGELDALLSGGSMAKGVLTRVVSRVESSLIALGRAMEEIARLAHGRFVENEENVLMVSGAVQNLISALGPAVNMEEKFEAPTLWGTTAFIGEEVGRIDFSVSGLLSEMGRVSNVARLTQEEVKGSKEGNSEANGKMLQILTLMMGRVQTLSPELDKIRDHVRTLDSEVKDSARHYPRPNTKRQKQGSNVTGEDNAMDDLMTILTSNASVSREGPRGVSPEKPHPGFEMDLTSSDDWRVVEVTLSRLEARVEMIVGDVGLLKACAEDKSIKFGGLGLRTLQECHSWIDDNFQGLHYGLVMDPLLMLDRIFGSEDVEAESQFKILESRVKLKITTGAEAAVIKAPHFNRPRLFHKGRVAMTSERNTSKLSKLPTYKSWKSGGEGVQNYITKQMNLVHSTVSHDMGYAFGSDPKLAQAQAVATTSLYHILDAVDGVY